MTTPGRTRGWQGDSERAPPAATHASGVARCVQRRVDTCGGPTAIREQAQTLCRLGIDVRHEPIALSQIRVDERGLRQVALDQHDWRGLPFQPVDGNLLIA